MSVLDFPGGSPFNGDPTQAARMRATVRVLVDGIDVTARMRPFLISVRVSQGLSQSIEIELDDRDALLPMPPLNASIQVSLGWTTESSELVVSGIVSQVTSTFARESGGRRMNVIGTAVSFLEGIKTPIQMHMGDGAPPGKDQGDLHSMTEWLTALSVASGVPVQIHPSFANVLRDYWSISGSLQHHAKQLADDVGGACWAENGALMVAPWGLRPLNDQKTIAAVWSKNLIGWKVTPFISRTIWGTASQSYFHNRLANTVSTQGPVLAGQANWQLPRPAPNAAVAQQNVGAAQANSGYSGMGRICINGEPTLRFNDSLAVSGARPGVDGNWICQEVEHLYSREGFVTWATVFSSPAAFQQWQSTGALTVMPTPSSSSAGIGG